MPLQEQIPDLAPAAAFREQIADCEKIPEGLAHLFPFHEQVCAMHPVLHKWTPVRLQPSPLTLRDLILVMWKSQVLTPDVQVKARSQDLHAHRAALDVPARTPLAPRARPQQVSIR